MMTGADVREVLDLLDNAAVTFWVDGGWGVDALLGIETRAHDDLDLVVSRGELENATAALARSGFRHAPEIEPGLPARYVLRDEDGRQVDLHAVVPDEDGNAHQELGGGSWGLYPAAGLAGRGRIGDRDVPCITAQLQLRHHTAYNPSAKDRADVRALAERFGLDLSPPHA